MRFRLIIIPALGALCLAAIAHGAGQSSAHYRISADVIDGGGGELTSLVYWSVFSIGQPAVIGRSTSFHYSLDHGFWGQPLATPTPGPTATPTPSPAPSPTSTPSPTPTLMATFTPPPSPTPFWGMKGDIDDNGRINTTDALLCFYFALGVQTPEPDEAWRADADNDGRVTTSDALCIYQEALGIPNSCFSFARGSSGGSYRLTDSSSAVVGWMANGPGVSR